MDQKSQPTPSLPPQPPNQLAQLDAIVQQPSVAPQAPASPASKPNVQPQAQTPVEPNLPVEQAQQPLAGPQLSKPTTKDSLLADVSTKQPENNVATAGTVDTEAPIKAKQLLHAQPNPPTEQETSDQEQLKYNSGKLEDQQANNELETDVDPTLELASWEALEFIAHEKPPYWHFAVMGVAIIVSVIIFAFTREVLSSLVVIVLGAVFAIYGSAKPKTILYRLTGEGIYADEKLHKYNDFKSFSVIETANLPYLQLLSRKRFMVPLTVHTEPNSIDYIKEIIGLHVPYHQQIQDPVDKLSVKLRF